MYKHKAALREFIGKLGYFCNEHPNYRIAYQTKESVQWINQI